MFVSGIPELWYIESVFPLSLRKGREGIQSPPEHHVEACVRIKAIG